MVGYNWGKCLLVISPPCPICFDDVQLSNAERQQFFLQTLEPNSTLVPKPTVTLLPIIPLIPTLIPEATNTPLPSLTPVMIGTASDTNSQTQAGLFGDNNGSICIGCGNRWVFSGKMGEKVIITVNAWDSAGRYTNRLERVAHHLLDTYVTLHQSDGTMLKDNDDIACTKNEANQYANCTDSMLEYTLPSDGDYYIEVRSFNDESGGDYSLSLESEQPVASPTITSSLSATLTPASG